MKPTETLAQRESLPLGLQPLGRRVGFERLLCARLCTRRFPGVSCFNLHTGLIWETYYVHFTEEETMATCKAQVPEKWQSRVLIPGNLLHFTVYFLE